MRRAFGAGPDDPFLTDSARLETRDVREHLSRMRDPAKIDATTLRDAIVNGRVAKRVLADAANVSMSTIERLETTGDATHLTLGQLDALATRVGLTIHDLICTTKAPDPEQVCDPQLVADLTSVLHQAQRPLSIHVLADIAPTLTAMASPPSSNN